MTVVDTSAVTAILFAEPEADRLVEFLHANRPCFMAAPNVVEFVMVAIGRAGLEGRAKALSLLDDLGIETVEFSVAMADLAADAFVRFGKGRHVAGLNYGDCMAFALGKALEMPLLFKGEDFAKTDIAIAMLPGGASN